MSYVAAFRTHRWDEDVAAIARRFFAAFPPSTRQVVVADETRGPLEVPHEKIRQTDRSCEELGLPAYPPGDVLWQCGDYALYELITALPDFDYYVMSEYDLTINLSLESMMAAIPERSIDIVLHDLQLSTPDWAWHEGGKAAFEEPWRCLMFFMVTSHRAAHAMLQARQNQARKFATGELQHSPNCETFIPSSLKALPDMRFEEVGAFADTSHLRFRPRMSCRDPRTSEPGSMAHPVHGSERFIPLLLRDRPPGEYFDEGSELRTGLAYEPFEDFLEPLGRSMVRARDQVGLAKLRQEVSARGLSIAAVASDLALNKPALSSSTSDWSDVRDPALDASGANAEWMLDEYGFHTAEEDNPWWMVDMLEAKVVDIIEILNRPTCSDRFVKFRIDSSLDASAWTTRYAKIDGQPVSSRPEAPWRQTFTDPFIARHVRIVLLESRMLHLRKVRLFGRTISSGAVPVYG